MPTFLAKFLKAIIVELSHKELDADNCSIKNKLILYLDLI